MSRPAHVPDAGFVVRQIHGGVDSGFQALPAGPLAQAERAALLRGHMQAEFPQGRIDAQNAQASGHRLLTHFQTRFVHAPRQ